MRLLFAALALPYPPVSGHRLRTWSMLQALAQEGHQVSLLTFIEANEHVDPAGPLARACRSIETIPSPSAGEGVGAATVGRLLSLASPLPHGARRFRTAAYRERLSRLLAEDTFDAIVCDGVYNLVNVPTGLRVPVLLNKDDVAHLILERYAALEDNPARRLYAQLEAKKVKQFEREQALRVRVVLACSDFDAGLLRALAPAAHVVVIPNVVDTSHYQPAGEGDPRIVLFQGGLDWHPNRDAVEYFAADILPELKRLVPDVRFRVAGRLTDDGFRRRLETTHGVEFSGTVADMRTEIAAAAVCVVPLRIGSGTRLKILEAAAMAKPMVSTHLGAEGLGFEDGREIVLADKPGRFARQVADLLREAGRRRALGKAARHRVEQDHSQEVLRHRLRNALALVGAPEAPLVGASVLAGGA